MAAMTKRGVFWRVLLIVRTLERARSRTIGPSAQGMPVTASLSTLAASVRLTDAGILMIAFIS